MDNALFAVTQLAQTTMRSDIGKISLDKTFEERDTLNRNIVQAIRRVVTSDATPVKRWRALMAATPTTLALQTVLHGLPVGRRCGWRCLESRPAHLHAALGVESSNEHRSSIVGCMSVASEG